MSSAPHIYLNPEQGYDAIAPYYDNWKWQEIWAAIEFPHIHRMLEEDRENLALNILDIGTGTGRTLKAIRDAFNLSSVHGIDVSRGMLKCAAARLPEPDTFTHIDLDEWRHHLLFDSSSFSHALLCRSAGHIPNLYKLLAEAQRVVLPSGKIFISDIHANHNYTDTHMALPDRTVHIETNKHTPEHWDHVARFLGLKICFTHVVTGAEIMALPGITPPKSILSPDQPVSMMMILEKH